MTQRKCIIYSAIVILISITVIILLTPQVEQQQRLYQQYSTYSFADTAQNLDIAISEHNYRIIHKSHIGQAIRDRGDSDYPLSTIINFCNITYAKEMLEIDPNLINDMPCIIAIREQKDNVVVSTQLMNEQTLNPQEQAFAQKINQNLKNIIDATIN
jgi:uncharacterized protein (DUF302 family)